MTLQTFEFWIYLCKICSLMLFRNISIAAPLLGVCGLRQLEIKILWKKRCVTILHVSSMDSCLSQLESIELTLDQSTAASYLSTQRYKYWVSEGGHWFSDRNAKAEGLLDQVQTDRQMCTLTCTHICCATTCIQIIRTQSLPCSTVQLFNSCAAVSISGTKN